MALSNTQWEKIGIYVRSYLLRTAEIHGHRNAQYRASARWTHTLNVVKNLRVIMDGEDVHESVRDVCDVAAMFHDIDHYTVELTFHAQRGAETAARFLKKENYASEFIDRVIPIIQGHHLDLYDEVPIEQQVQEIISTHNHETRMVMDADTLDKIGVTNILQALLTMNPKQARLAEAAKELTSGWPLQRASLWKQMLTTATGKRLGEARFSFYERFLHEISTEIVMDDPFPSITQTQETAQLQG